LRAAVFTATLRSAHVDERARKIGHNESMFRQVNERIERVAETLQPTSDRLGILCECGDQTCTEQLDVAITDYERIRSDSTLFFVRKGHELSDVDNIVEQTAEYDVVRKKPGVPAGIARDLDPRSD
jgi:hypothetical protein